MARLGLRVREQAGQYAALWRRPGVARLLIPAEFIRLIPSVEPLAIFLFVEHRTHSYGAAATALAAFSISLGLAWPVHGRLIDVLGLRPVVGVLAAAHATALALFFLATRGPLWCTVLGVALVASTVSPMGSATRALWVQMLPPGPLLDRANAMEAALIEVLFMIGPALAGLLATAFGPLVAALLAGAILVTASVAFVTAPAIGRLRPARPPTGEVRLRRSGWRAPGIPAVLVAIGLGASTFAVLQVTVPATIAADGMSSATGVMLLSLPSAASALGGLAYGTRRHVRAPFERYLILLAAMCLCLIPLTIPSPVGVLAACLFLAGLPQAAVSSEEFGLIGQLAPKNTINETFALATTMIAMGETAGSLAAGALVTSVGPASARILAPGAVLLAIGMAWLAREAASSSMGHASSNQGGESAP
jgi:predicted MFS family arabinose efflux permease